MASSKYNSVDYSLKVNSSDIKLYKKEDSTSQVVSILGGGSSCTATKTTVVKSISLGKNVNTTWYYINKLGWATSSHFTMVQDNSKATGKEITKDTIQYAADNNYGWSDENLAAVYTSYVNSEKSADTSGKYLTKNMNNILGLPYQFPGSVDRKIDGSVFGRTYAERILTNMPLLLLTPGKVSFMSDVSKSTKSKITDTLAKLGINKDLTYGDSDLSSYLNKPTKYYTFEFDSGYYQYVDSILNSTAVLLGIGDVTVDICGTKGKLKNFKWSNASNPLTKNVGNSSISYVCMYIDAITTKNESFSNDTMESQLYSKINSFSDTAKEIQFLLGDNVMNSVNAVSNDLLSQAQSTIDSIVDSTLSGNAILKDLSGQFSTIAQGGKILFPQIYSDSSFSQSYDVSMKLRCPNPTPLNWYMDIMVPLGFLYSLVLPRSVGNTGYKSPYLVRGFYKSAYNIDMGIIADMGVSKGKEGSWTQDGLPTEVDVDFTIKDLYNVLYMSKCYSANQWGDFVTNDQFMGFLANQVGVNINQTDIERTFALYNMMVSGTGSHTLNYWQNSITGGFNNKILKMYKGIFKST